LPGGRRGRFEFCLGGKTKASGNPEELEEKGQGRGKDVPVNWVLMTAKGEKESAGKLGLDESFVRFPVGAQQNQIRR